VTEGLPLERLVLAASPDGPDGAPPETWWARYEASLSEVSGLSPTVRRVIRDDSQYILEMGIGAGGFAQRTWPASRLRSGLVMGSVQSGKTASMLGVSAMSLDAGIDAVVLLAGTRVSLWRQTYDRLVSQLGPARDDLLIPSPAVMALESPSPQDLYRDLTAARARRLLRERRPVLIVVMKHGQHLRAVRDALHRSLYPEVAKLDRDFELLVLDDESDDGSVLDARVESAMDPYQDALKQIPRHIADLWSDRARPHESAQTHLVATYVGYTATPQANFLQEAQNPLAPRDFVAALRTPGPNGSVEDRSPTFSEPLGLTDYYTGGETFYAAVRDPAPLTVTEDQVPRAGRVGPPTRSDWIRHSVRAYLVAGAVLLWRDHEARRLSTAHTLEFATREDVKKSCPAPHSMLLHPSSAVDDHFAVLEELSAWSFSGQSTGSGAGTGNTKRLPLEALTADLETHEHEWRGWLAGYRQTAAAVAGAYALEAQRAIPDDAAWPEVRALLLSEVIPHVRLSVVNSDPEADDRPAFDPSRTEDGLWVAPKDIYTIFISGNVMARGLTLEGLTTSLFLRTSGDPLADTQMQMQRWFGYRGGILELCRVFVPDQQLRLFAQYNEADEALRAQILAVMRDEPGSAPSPLVLEGARFRATGKIASVSKVPLCPGPTPFVDMVNDGGSPDPNASIVENLFAEPSRAVLARGTERGRALDRSLTLTEAAALLDRLRYDQYVPDPAAPTSTRWDALAHQLGLHDVEGLHPLFRPPAAVDGGASHEIPPQLCPYNIAAYLRLWDACLLRRARGLFPTEDGERPWSSLDLSQRVALQPRFRIGLRYGSVGEDAFPVDHRAALPFDVLLAKRNVEHGRITSTWGTRNPGETEDAYRGDQLFDYYAIGEAPPMLVSDASRWRPVGSPGMLLFHLIKVGGYDYPVVALGAAIPLGGPDHFAARAR